MHRGIQARTRSGLITACVLLGGLLQGCESPGQVEDSVGQRSSAASATADLMDFLIQDVCVGAATQDPHTCTSRRNLQPGEWLYYDRYDQVKAQIRNSFPAWSDGEVVVNTFDFAPFGVWNPAADGYDVIETSPPYVSIIDTRDPTGLGQTFIRLENGGCELNDTWLLFPNDGYHGSGSRVAKLHKLDWELNAQARPGICSGGDVSAYTAWQKVNVTYTGGKTLESVTSHHYDAATVSQSMASEKFYFTRIYGLTRWEAWRKGGTPIPDANCNGTKVVGEWVMVDCRDWTHVVPNAAGRDPKQWPAPVPQSATVTYEAEGAELGHALGRAEGDGWSASTAWDAPGHLVYGPYVSLPAGPKTAFFELLVDNNTADNLRVVNLDVHDASAGAIRAGRGVLRQEFEAAWAYHSFALDFTAASGNAHEFRVWWDDAAYVRVDRIRIGEPRRAWVLPMNPLTFEAEGTAMRHAIGRADSDGWSAATALDPAGFLAFGPYTDQLIGGARTASFRLMVDNHTADNLRVVSLDVYDATAKVVRASRAVTRREFAAAWAYQDFTVSFNAIGGHQHELRVWWDDVSYVRLDRVSVR